MELAEEFVEQMPGGRTVAVADCSPVPVVVSRWRIVCRGGERSDPAGVGEAVVLDVAVGH
jgi:hypothetical protein